MAEDDALRRNTCINQCIITVVTSMYSCRLYNIRSRAQTPFADYDKG
jgi:hypothetical protein